MQVEQGVCRYCWIGCIIPENLKWKPQTHGDQKYSPVDPSFQTRFWELAPGFRGNGAVLLKGVNSWARTLLNWAST
jgi:hypothetical protein